MTVFVFFFQAEDGIRDESVTGVQTCALPIYFGPPTRAALHAQTVHIVEHVDLAPAHLLEPRRGHHRAHPFRVDENDARVAHRDVLVARLHELPAGSMPRAGEMPTLEFLPCADVEEIQGSAGILLPVVDLLRSRELDSKTRCNPLGNRQGLRLTLLGG